MAENTAPLIVWLRTDLRMADHPALHAAVASGAPLLCVYVHDTQSEGQRPAGGASLWWLHHSLAALGAALAALGGRLDILAGAAADVLPALAEAAGASGLVMTRRYGAAETRVYAAVAAALARQQRTCTVHEGYLLHDPVTFRSGQGGTYRVFTPFWRALHRTLADVQPLPAPTAVAAADWPSGGPTRSPLNDLRLLPTKLDWAGGLRETWVPGEASARKRLGAWLKDGLGTYATDRNIPSVDRSSRLSPHLHFGEISPRQVLFAVRHAAARYDVDPSTYLAEIGWREFNYHVLVANPDLATRAFNERYADFPFRSAQREFTLWTKGLTGYPIVDAGMRQLWQTGFMHNRLRLVTASLLVKHLLVDWREGERWFWDTLCDADPANNPGNWQWVAGSGPDAALFVRVFNPVLQGEKFDPEGTFVRAYVPELAAMPARWIHRPWEAPADALEAAGVRLGDTYPLPVVDHADARARALAVHAGLRRA